MQKTQECSETAKLDRADEISPNAVDSCRRTRVRRKIHYPRDRGDGGSLSASHFEITNSPGMQKLSVFVEIVTITREDSRPSSDIHRANAMMLAHKARWQLFVMRQQI